MLATITEMLQTSLIPMFCSAKQVLLLKDSDDCHNLMDRKVRSKRGAFILYRKIKLYQDFLPPSAAVHSAPEGRIYEYMVWGKFCLCPAQGGSSQESKMGGFAMQEDGIGDPLTQDCSSCSVLQCQM